MEIKDRRENGQFAPKGTGDQTGRKVEEREGKHGSLESGLKKGLGLDDKVEDWEISEAVSDMEYYIRKDETIGEVAEQVAKKLNVSKLHVVQVMTKEMDADANAKYWDAVDLWNEKNNK